MAIARSKMNALILDNARLVLEEGILESGGVLVEGKKIIKILKAGQRRPKIPAKDLSGAFLSPGFVDLHVHGAVGRDAIEGTVEAWEKISRYHAAGGTTSFALTTMACEWSALEGVLSLAKQKPVLSGAKLLGIHVEGPFLSPVKAGVQQKKHLCHPKDVNWRKFLDKYADAMTQMTLAPELPGAMALIRGLKKRGVIVSAGHTNAEDDLLAKAFVNGMDNATHWPNALSSSRKKGAFRHAGAMEFALAEEEMFVEVIADGFHVCPTLLRMVYSTKGAEKIALVTDATAGAGLPRESVFQIGGNIRAKVHRGYALTLKGDSLAGSTIRMIDAVRIMVQQTGVPLHKAVQMATSTPAQRLGLFSKIGSLRPGARADLVVFNNHFKVLQTWREGCLSS